MNREGNYSRKRSFLKRLAGIAVAFLLTMFFAKVKAETESFTLMIYMTGSNLETEGQAASNDIQEMTEAWRPDSNIRVIVQAGGSECTGTGVNFSKSTRLEIGEREWKTITEDAPNNMGAAATLSDFLSWAYTYAPADRYGLILWDHGAGPLMGVCFDEQFSDDETGMDSLMLSELTEALQQSPFKDQKLEFFGFDACLMGSLEVAAAVSPFANYMIASQEIEPVCGWNYAFLSEVFSSDDGKDWGMKIISKYEEFLRDSLDEVTLSCLDLAQMKNVLAEAESFFGSITEKITVEKYSEYTRCRADTQTYGSSTTSNFDLIDLVDLIAEYEKQELTVGTRFRDALAKLIVAHYPEGEKHINGISIYYPFDNKQKYIASWSSAYQRFSFSPGYQQFINSISEIYLREALFDRTSEYQVDLHEEAGRIRLDIKLTEEEISSLVRSRLIVLEKLASDTYRMIYYDDQKIKVSDKGVSASYSGEALYIVDDEKNIIAGPISYFPLENGVVLYGLLYKNFHSESVRLVYLKDENGDLRLDQIMKVQSGTDGMHLPSAINMKDYDEILLLSFGPANVKGENTITSLQFSLFFPDWTVSLDPRDNTWGIALLPEWNRNERIAYLRLTDVQNETSFSEISHVPNYNYMTIATPQQDGSEDLIRVNLDEGVLVTGYDAGMLFTLRINNPSEETIEMEISEVRLNDRKAVRGSFDSYRYLLAPGEEGLITVFLPLETLGKMQLPEEVSQVEFQIETQTQGNIRTKYLKRYSLTMNTAIMKETAE